MPRYSTATLFDSLRARSIGAHRRIADGKRWGVEQSEDTITETLLLSLRRAFPYLKVRHFTRYGESKTGADWEWWWRGSDRWFHVLVQAKRLIRLRRGVLGYRFDYKVGEERIPQYELLLRAATTRLAAPIYVLYNGPDLIMPSSWPCGVLPKRRDVMGASFLAGEAAAGRARLAALEQSSIRGLDWPLPCIVCPFTRSRCGLPMQFWTRTREWQSAFMGSLGFPSGTGANDLALLASLAYTRSIISLRLQQFRALGDAESRAAAIGSYVARAVKPDAPPYVDRILQSTPDDQPEISSEDLGPYPPQRVVVVTEASRSNQRGGF
ncbi:MAG TPA: DUF6615 family protein [Acidimicrobiia bacterium]|nr:DUF6615 family protein [Acidimicrobiia bacterium]